MSRKSSIESFAAYPEILSGPDMFIRLFRRRLALLEKLLSSLLDSLLDSHNESLTPSLLDSHNELANSSRPSILNILRSV